MTQQGHTQEIESIARPLSSELKPPEPCATVYVFGVKRPRDSAPWFLAFTDQQLADRYPHRCTAVTAVHLYDPEVSGVQSEEGRALSST